MNQESQQGPIAIRVTRPFESVDELLVRELDAFSPAGVVLVGAQARPQGLVLRFELVLKNGEPVLRGEGRVVGHGPVGSEGLSGLHLRFTRIDVRSKSVLDRASAMRKNRGAPQDDPPHVEFAPMSDRGPSSVGRSAPRPSSRPAPATPHGPDGSRPPSPSRGDSADFPAVPQALAPPFPPPELPSIADVGSAESPSERAKAPLTSHDARPAAPAAAHATAPRVGASPPAAPSATKVLPPMAPPPHRDTLLAKLRARAKAAGYR